MINREVAFRGSQTPEGLTQNVLRIFVIPEALRAMTYLEVALAEEDHHQAMVFWASADEAIAFATSVLTLPGETRLEWAARMIGDESLTLEAVGSVIGVSRERVRQLTSEVSKSGSRNRRADRDQRLAPYAIRMYEAGFPPGDIESKLSISKSHLPGMLKHADKELAARSRQKRIYESRRGHRTWPKDKAVAAILRCAEELGKVPTGMEYTQWRYDGGSGPSLPTIAAKGIQGVEGWNHLVALANLGPYKGPYAPRSDRTSESKALDDLITVIEELGSLPTYHEYERIAREKGLTSGTTVRRRLGGAWPEALTAADEELQKRQ